MQPLELTWSRALKVWWSYSWRACVLTLLVIIPLDIVLFVFVFRSMPARGSAPDPARMAGMAATMVLLWPLLIAVAIAVQVQAMRWMLRAAQWSDFRIELVSRD